MKYRESAKFIRVLVGDAKFTDLCPAKADDGVISQEISDQILQFPLRWRYPPMVLSVEAGRECDTFHHVLDPLPAKS
jgi:hypothetical protein